jgi:hypothetical protein
VVNQAKANSIKPAGSAQYVLVDHRLERAQDPLFVNSFEPVCHDAFIVAAES